jgi:actin-related protein 2
MVSQIKNDVDFTKIICDNGTGYLKLGYAGDNFPRFTIPSIVGRPLLRSNQNVDGVALSEVMFGDEANPYRSLLEINYPIEEGRIKSQEDFAALWEYSFTKKMGVKKDDFQDRRLFVTEAAMNTRQNREMLAEIIFEKYNFGACMFET